MVQWENFVHRWKCFIQIVTPQNVVHGNRLVTLSTAVGDDKGETAVRDCHCPDDMAVRMRKPLAKPAMAWCLRAFTKNQNCLLAGQLIFKWKSGPDFLEILKYWLIVEFLLQLHQSG